MSSAQINTLLSGNVDVNRMSLFLFPDSPNMMQHFYPLDVTVLFYTMPHSHTPKVSTLKVAVHGDQAIGYGVTQHNMDC